MSKTTSMLDFLSEICKGCFINIFNRLDIVNEMCQKLNVLNCNQCFEQQGIKMNLSGFYFNCYFSC